MKFVPFSWCMFSVPFTVLSFTIRQTHIGFSIIYKIAKDISTSREVPWLHLLQKINATVCVSWLSRVQDHITEPVYRHHLFVKIENTQWQYFLKIENNSWIFNLLIRKEWKVQYMKREKYLLTGVREHAKIVTSINVKSKLKLSLFHSREIENWATDEETFISISCFTRWAVYSSLIQTLVMVIISIHFALLICLLQIFPSSQE
jgi:hypothetical protein